MLLNVIEQLQGGPAESEEGARRAQGQDGWLFSGAVCKNVAILANCDKINLDA